MGSKRFPAHLPYGERPAITAVNRYHVRWRRWDAAVASGERPADFIPRLNDEALVQLLACGDPASRRYELDVLCTEILNRLRRMREALGDVAQAAEHSIGAALDEAEAASGAIDETVASIEAHISARSDAIGNEPETARSARRATLRVKETLRDAGAFTDDLARLAAGDPADEPA